MKQVIWKNISGALLTINYSRKQNFTCFNIIFCVYHNNEMYTDLKKLKGESIIFILGFKCVAALQDDYRYN